MKSNIKETPTTKKYPYLGIYDMNPIDNVIVVLFTGPNTGTLVYSQKSSGLYLKMGEYSNKWTEKEYKPFNGIIELSNE